jgi:hypothetical protein
MDFQAYGADPRLASLFKNSDLKKELEDKNLKKRT